MSIKPICDSLSVNYSTKVKKIKEGKDLKSTVGLSPIVASNGKNIEVASIDFNV